MSKAKKSKSIPRISAEIRGVRYNLIPRTLYIQEKIEGLENYAKKHGTGDISAKEFYSMLVDFVKSTTKCKDFDGKITEIDLAELEIAVKNILHAYENQANHNTESFKKFAEMIGKKNV